MRTPKCQREIPRLCIHVCQIFSQSKYIHIVLKYMEVSIQNYLISVGMGS